MDTANAIVAWGDIVSLFSFLACAAIGGVHSSVPVYVWGVSIRYSLSVFCIFTLSAIWTIFRLSYEAIHQKFGPREFLLVNVLYLVRWIYLWSRVYVLNTKERKMFRVARALRNVQMFRIGRSSDATRRGELEVVMRKGVRREPAGQLYWRGVKTFENIHRDVGIWEISLVQKELHRDDLDMTSQFVEADYAAIDMAYKCFYKVVMKAVKYREPTEQEIKSVYVWDSSVGMDDRPEGYTGGQRVGGGVPRVEVDFSGFTTKWLGLPVEGLAVEAEAVDARMIGRVARRIAADGCAYINDDSGEYEFRTERQVEALNECLRQAAGSVFIGGLREGHELGERERTGERERDE